MNKQQPLLQINNLSLAYGAKEILKAVHLTVCPGEILGIVGSSGGGKSTLLKTLTGLLPANAVITGGEILWQGHSLLSGGRLNSSGLLGRKLSMIFQDPTASLYPLQTIGSQICTMLQAQGQFDKAASLQSAAQVLAGLDFSKPQAILNSYPFRLSGGMNQRVCIAMALLLKPELLLADEPTSGLDLLTQQKILRHLLQLKTDHHTALIVVSHNISALAQIADTIAVLRQGEIIESGPPQTILNRPQHDYTRKLIEAIPHFRKEFLL